MILSQLLFRSKANRALCNLAFEKEDKAAPAFIMPCTSSLNSSLQPAVSGLLKAWKKHLHCVTMRSFVKGRSLQKLLSLIVKSKKLSTAALKCRLLHYSVGAVLVVLHTGAM